MKVFPAEDRLLKGSLDFIAAANSIAPPEWILKTDTSSILQLYVNAANSTFDSGLRYAIVLQMVSRINIILQSNQYTILFVGIVCKSHPCFGTVLTDTSKIVQWKNSLAKELQISPRPMLTITQWFINDAGVGGDGRDETVFGVGRELYKSHHSKNKFCRSTSK